MDIVPRMRRAERRHLLRKREPQILDAGELGAYPTNLEKPVAERRQEGDQRHQEDGEDSRSQRQPHCVES